MLHRGARAWPAEILLIDLLHRIQHVAFTSVFPVSSLANVALAQGVIDMCGAHEEVQYPVRSKLTIEFRCEVNTTRSNLLAPNKTTFLIAPMGTICTQNKGDSEFSTAISRDVPQIIQQSGIHNRPISSLFRVL